ncbi:MAG: radical SAM protein, partial [Cellulosilyticaceae bacterium]
VRGIICFGFGVTMREGNREYFYEQLDKLFPGVKNQYIRTYGESYMCDSKNHKHLMEIFEKTCAKHNILYKPEDVFAYLKKFETNKQQLSLFE